VQSFGEGQCSVANRILLIDDSRAIHGLVRAELAFDCMEFYGAFDGASGIASALDFHPDVILLDVEMPGMNGYDVCELLGVQPATAGIPVIFLSATAKPEDKVRGLNQGASDFIAKPFTGDELRARVRVALRHKFLLQLESRRAMRDALTGLWNRAYFDERLKSDIAAATRHGWPLSCIMIDIDHFKLINDTHGHPFGDRVIREVAAVMEQQLRREDSICRYGGEEFVVLCPGVAADGAHVLAERVRTAVAELIIKPSTERVAVTCSVGLSDLLASGSDGMVAAADAALYRAKNAGRNCVAGPSPALPAVCSE
jgi:two-component system, cell cycle response regulator